MIPVRTAAVNSLPRVSASSAPVQLHCGTAHMACRSCNKTYVSLQPHFLLLRRSSAHGKVEIFFRVTGGNLCCGCDKSFRNDRIAETDDMNALFRHTACKFPARSSDRYNITGTMGCSPNYSESKPIFSHLRAGRVLMNTCRAARRRFLQQVDRRIVAAQIAARQRDGENAGANAGQQVYIG